MQEGTHGVVWGGWGCIFDEALSMKNFWEPLRSMNNFWEPLRSHSHFVFLERASPICSWLGYRGGLDYGFTKHMNKVWNTYADYYAYLSKLWNAHGMHLESIDLICFFVQTFHFCHVLCVLYVFIFVFILLGPGPEPRAQNGEGSDMRNRDIGACQHAPCLFRICLIICGHMFINLLYVVCVSFRLSTDALLFTTEEHARANELQII